MATALLFSGQGAQRVGMGRSFYDNSPLARSLYDEADAVLGYSLKQLCFDGPEDALTQTRVCQPALYVLGYVAYKLLEAQGRLADCRAALGLSLGELTALAAAGVFDFSTGLRLVAARAGLMQQACETTRGGMAALIGGDRALVEAFCREQDVDMANLNSPGQIVISGESDRIVGPEYGRTFARAIHFARFEVLPETGHMPMIETPELLLKAIQNAGDTPGGTYDA